MTVSDGPFRTPEFGPGAPADAFFRQMVAGMRNGVLAITRAGDLALLNDEGYRVLGITRRHGDLGRSVNDEIGRAHV